MRWYDRRGLSRYYQLGKKQFRGIGLKNKGVNFSLVDTALSTLINFTVNVALLTFIAYKGLSPIEGSVVATVIFFTLAIARKTWLFNRYHNNG